MIEVLGPLPAEVCVAAVDSSRHRHVRVAEVGAGGSDHVDVDVDAVRQLAKEAGTGAVIFLTHNHPAGDDGEAPMPSAADFRAAIALREELRDLGVELVECVVCGDACRIVRASRLGARYARRCRR
jgi:DNA repair protein RadC